MSVRPAVGSDTRACSFHRRLLVVVILALVATWVWRAPAAFAHAHLTDSTPRDGDELVAQPSEVVLVFDDGVRPAPDGIVVVGADGSRADTGDAARRDHHVVGVGLRPHLAPQGYRVSWRVITDDGHVVDGALSFQLVPAPSGDDTAVAAGAEAGDSDTTALPRAEDLDEASFASAQHGAEGSDENAGIGAFAMVGLVALAAGAGSSAVFAAVTRRQAKAGGA